MQVCCCTAFRLAEVEFHSVLQTAVGSTMTATDLQRVIQLQLSVVLLSSKPSLCGSVPPVEAQTLSALGSKPGNRRLQHSQEKERIGNRSRQCMIRSDSVVPGTKQPPFASPLLFLPLPSILSPSCTRFVWVKEWCGVAVWPVIGSQWRRNSCCLS